MAETLKTAVKLRPLAKWGYYGVIGCDGGWGIELGTCEDLVTTRNDALQELWASARTHTLDGFGEIPHFPRFKCACSRGDTCGWFHSALLFRCCAVAPSGVGRGLPAAAQHVQDRNLWHNLSQRAFETRLQSFGVIWR